MGRRGLIGLRKRKGRKEERPRPEPAMAQGKGGGELCGEGTWGVLRQVHAGMVFPRLDCLSLRRQVRFQIRLGLCWSSFLNIA